MAVRLGKIGVYPHIVVCSMREYIHRAVIVEVLIEALVAKWAESLGRFGLLKISTAI